MDISPDLRRFFKDFSEGYKRNVAKAKDEGILKNHEGKAPVNYILLFAGTVRVFNALDFIFVCSSIHDHVLEFFCAIDQCFGSPNDSLVMVE